MAQKQMRTPSGSAGLVRYDEEDNEVLIRLKPSYIFGIAIGFIILELILYLSFPL
jgi:preprotein translocase subunit Sec61beta